MSYWTSTTTAPPLIVGKMTLTAICRQWQASTTKKGVARVHVLADGKTIMGFYTLANISIELDLKGYPRSTPAIMIGRMGVDNRYQGQGYSKILLSHAIQSIKHISTITGVMVIVIDAKDEQLAQYYEQFGFVPTANPLRLILNVCQI